MKSLDIKFLPQILPVASRCNYFYPNQVMCILYGVWITALSFEIDVLDRKQKWEFSLLVARLKSFIWLLSSFHTMQKAVYFISLSLGFLGINRLVIFFARKVCKWLFKALLHLPCEVYHIAVLPKKEFWWECVFWLDFTEFLARQETGTTGRCCKHCSVCVCVCVFVRTLLIFAAIF